MRFMYNDFLATLNVPISNNRESSRTANLLNRPGTSDYEFVRYGVPSGVIKWEENIEHCKRLANECKIKGYDKVVIKTLPSNLRKHVAKFRCCLDFWEQFSKNKVFSKEELFCRCLEEGPSFTEFIKEMRATCFRAVTSETPIEIEEEYFSDRYDGYNSILHERYLIYWDDRSTIDDIKYAFVPVRSVRKKEIRALLDELWKDFKLDEVEFEEEFDMIGSIKNTSMFDPTKRKESFLMRDLWNSDINPDDPYYAKRSIVPTPSRKTRDTGVGTASTIFKVKQLNSLARKLSERIPYSANTDENSCNSRYKRVLRNNLFLHLDFKKFGLTFPRYIINEVIRKIIDSSGTDYSHLYINDFFIEIDGEAYRTERGTMLGWLDSINSIAIMAILHGLSKDLKFDFVTFNDDVEISKKSGDDASEVLTLLRLAVINEMDFFDILVSVNKTFGSKMSVFLERYAYYKEYNIDMYKEQLTVEAYSNSCVAIWPWQAKLYFAAAEQWTKSDYAVERCIDTCPIEFRKEECCLPLWSGGWYIWRKNSVDMSLEYSDKAGIALGVKLSRYKLPRYSQPLKKGSSENKISAKVNNQALNHSSKYAFEQIYEIPSIAQISDDVEIAVMSFELLCDAYQGRSENYPEDIRLCVKRRINEGPGPPVRRGG